MLNAQLSVLASVPTAYLYRRPVAIATLKATRFIGLGIATACTAAFALWLHSIMICISVLHGNWKAAGISPLLNGPSPKPALALPAMGWNTGLVHGPAIAPLFSRDELETLLSATARKQEILKPRRRSRLVASLQR